MKRYIHNSLCPIHQRVYSLQIPSNIGLKEVHSTCVCSCPSPISMRTQPMETFSKNEIFISATEVSMLVMLALTVDVEEGFHGLWPSAHNLIKHHKSPQGAFRRPLRNILNLFEREHVSSTFFVLGEIAEVFPGVVEEIYELGHEVASHGYFHVDLTKISLSELEEMERKNRSILARITGEMPIGFRAPFARINPAIVSLLSKIGYTYNSSVVPSVGIPGCWSNYGASLSPHRVSVREKRAQI